MKKIVLLAFVLVLFSTAIIWGFMSPTVGHTNESNNSYGDRKFVFVNSKTIWVPDNFTSIQEAINNASDGDTIFVEPGTYYENVVINKSVRLVGENKHNTIIDGYGFGDIIRVITRNNITISNFTLQNGDNGIVLGGRDHIIFCNIIQNNSIGIQIPGSYPLANGNCTISNNVIANNEIGIVITSSDSNTLRNNAMEDNDYNLYVEGEELSHFLNIIDESNTIEGKPVYYLVNRTNLTIDRFSFSDAGLLALINSRNCTVRDLTLTKNGMGLLFAYTNGSTVENVTILNNIKGVHLIHSNDNQVRNNVIYNNQNNLWLTHGSNSNVIEYNEVNYTQNYATALRSGSCNNVLRFNVIAHNTCGIDIDSESHKNIIYQNNFINNIKQTSISGSYGNVWDDGYPSGGNYWSDYTGVDANIDGIGDSSYEIDSMNIDHYPLMGMSSDFPATLEEEKYHVTTVCNSTISAFEFDQVNRIISFNVTGEEGIGFCRVYIPHDLMEPPYTVTVDGYAPLYVNYTLYDNGTHRWIYFTYLHSTHKVGIIPEFLTCTSMLLILIVLTVAIAIYKRRLLKTPIH